MTTHSRLVALFCLPVGAALAVLAGCSESSSDPWSAAGHKRKVLVSFPPLYSFAKSVAGDDAEVKCLMTGEGAHFHGDATPAKIRLAAGCDVFFLNGLLLDDDLANKLKGPAANKKWNVLDLGSKLKVDWLLAAASDHDHDAKGHAHDHATTDPHVWLGIRHAKAMTESIRDELKHLDPDHAAGYDSRTATYLAKLDRLAADGQAELKDKKERKFVSFHDSLGYFAETYGLKIAGVVELSPGVEPTGDEMKEVIGLCQTNNVRLIAVEPQFPSKTSARAIRDALRGSKDKPIDAEFIEIDPLETADERDLSADLYERKMRENIANLVKALR